MSTKDVLVPDIGDFKDIPVIEIFVKRGDTVRVDDILVTLESDKAVLEVPAPFGGTVAEVLVTLGDKVSEGTVIVKLTTEERAAVAVVEPAPSVPVSPVIVPVASVPEVVASPPVVLQEAETGLPAHATPSVRAFARELGVTIDQVPATGPKGRILREDVLAFVKARVQSPAPAGGTVSAGLGLLPWPQVDFAKFGTIERVPLSRLRKISGPNLARNWVMIPHVTNFDEADVTELEAFRKTINAEHAKSGVKVTMLAFLIRATVAVLKAYPEFNASLDGEELILKRYFHIGFAADTPNGLVVPVIRDADTKGVLQIAEEMGRLAGLAREGKLKPGDMQGGCFSVSSLGGIGGTGFTPIINAPEVAILGAAKAQTKPVWDGDKFVPRLILPLSLSWDHRVVDGAAAGRFLNHLSVMLGDFRRILL